MNSHAIQGGKVSALMPSMPVQSVRLIASWLIDPLICPCLAASR